SPDKAAGRIRGRRIGIAAVADGDPRVRFAYPGYRCRQGGPGDLLIRKRKGIWSRVARTRMDAASGFPATSRDRRRWRPRVRFAYPGYRCATTVAGRSL